MIACNRQAPAQNALAQDGPVPNAPAATQPVESTAVETSPAQNALSINNGQAQTGLREVPLTIRSKTGLHHFTVEVAATPDQQERGLMFRKSIAPDRG
ncbi:MAG TPA: DUF192 domain-containing protein, partial [Sphingomicrobium sp.]|nr:DUF192 domain-containing protein [Sphingomicrobium sp.]